MIVRSMVPLAGVLLVGLIVGLTRAGEAPAQIGPTGTARADSILKRTRDRMIAVGERAPDFSLPDARGKTFHLKEMLGRPMVLYFYPKDESPGCTTQACAFRDDHDRFDSLGVRVVGISVDTRASHRAFAEHYRLPFTILADSTAYVTTVYGLDFVIARPDDRRTIARRATYLIDGEGIVRQVWPRVDPATNSGEVLTAARQLVAAKPR